MLLKGDMEKKLLNYRVLSDLMEQLSELLQALLEPGVQKCWTRRAVNVCDLPHSDGQLVRDFQNICFKEGG